LLFDREARISGAPVRNAHFKALLQRLNSGELGDIVADRAARRVGGFALGVRGFCC
jgi:hypothetical protein